MKVFISNNYLDMKNLDNYMYVNTLKTNSKLCNDVEIDFHNIINIINMFIDIYNISYEMGFIFAIKNNIIDSVCICPPETETTCNLGCLKICNFLNYVNCNNYITLHNHPNDIPIFSNKDRQVYEFNKKMLNEYFHVIYNYCCSYSGWCEWENDVVSLSDCIREKIKIKYNYAEDYDRLFFLDLLNKYH